MINIIIEYGIYLYLFLGVLHYIVYANKFEVGFFGNIFLIFICLMIGAPLFVYELLIKK